MHFHQILRSALEGQVGLVGLRAVDGETTRLPDNGPPRSSGWVCLRKTRFSAQWSVRTALGVQGVVYQHPWNSVAPAEHLGVPGSGELVIPRVSRKVPSAGDKHGTVVYLVQGGKNRSTRAILRLEMKSQATKGCLLHDASACGMVESEMDLLVFSYDVARIYPKYGLFSLFLMPLDVGLVIGQLLAEGVTPFFLLAPSFSAGSLAELIGLHHRSQPIFAATYAERESLADWVHARKAIFEQCRTQLQKEDAPEESTRIGNDMAAALDFIHEDREAQYSGRKARLLRSERWGFDEYSGRSAPFRISAAPYMSAAPVALESFLHCLKELDALATQLEGCGERWRFRILIAAENLSTVPRGQYLWKREVASLELIATCEPARIMQAHLLKNFSPIMSGASVFLAVSFCRPMVLWKPIVFREVMVACGLLLSCAQAHLSRTGISSHIVAGFRNKAMSDIFRLDASSALLQGELVVGHPRPGGFLSLKL